MYVENYTTDSSSENKTVLPNLPSQKMDVFGIVWVSDICKYIVTDLM